MKLHTQRSIIGALILSSGLSVGLLPQSRAEAPDDDVKKKQADIQIEEVVVTGSSIKTKRDEVAVSVVNVDAEQIEKGGVKSDLLEILRKQVPSFQGRSNTGASNANNTNQNTAGGAQIQLRNLDTLILVNGRRTAISGIAAIGGKAFVNASQIPTSAIDHIEVLSDGASAIYGSDAIGGVVNVILKSGYDGVDFGTRYGTAKDYSENSTYFTAGKTGDDFSITVSGSKSHTDPLYQNKRDFSSPIRGRVNVVPGTISGAAILASNLNSPSATNPTGANATAPSLAALIANGTYLAATNAGIASTYDISQFQTLMLKQDQDALSLNASYNLLDKRLVAFSDVEYTENKSFTQFLPITTTVTVPAGAPSNPITGNFTGVNFADWARPKQFNNDQKAIRATFGLRGDIGDGWSWEAAFLHSKNTLDQLQSNLIYKPNIPLAIAGGYDANGNAVAGGAYSRVYGGYSTSNPFVFQPALDPFARAAGLNPASLNNVYGTEVINTSSTLDSFDASINGNAFELPAGKVGFATGVAHRTERLAAHTDPNGTNTGPTAQRWLGGTYADAFSKSRTVDATFLEVRIPIASEKLELPGAHALDLIGAIRQEKYSDAGNSFVPKVGFRWQPVDSDFTVRGSSSKSFTAPTLFAEYGPTDTRLVGSGVIQTVFGLANPGLQGMDGNNPNLKPSKSDTQSLSFVFKPKAIPGLTLSLEYNSVVQHGFPGGIGFTTILQSVNQQGAASPFSANLAKGNFPGLPGATAFANPGDLLAYLQANPNNALNVYAIDQFRNLGGVRVKSFLPSGEYRWDTANAGTFTIGTVGTIFESYKFQALKTQKFYEYAGTATNGGTGVQGTLPKYRFYTTLDWQDQHWGATLANTYVSSVKDIGAGGIVYETSTTLKPLHVDSYVTWDVRLGYTGDAIPAMNAKGWSVSGGINNIANRMPPLSPQAFTDNNADVATYSPIGRLYYLTASVKF